MPEFRLYDMDDEEPPARPRPPRAEDSNPSEYIQGGAGKIHLDDDNRLFRISLDPMVIRRMNPDRLGDYIAAAINRAEQPGQLR